MKLRRASHVAHGTGLLGGRLTTALPLVWTGSAAEAAVQESTELAHRCRSVLLHLPAAATALERHAAVLEDSQHAVRRLQHEWDRAVEQHHLTVAAVRLRLGTDPDAPRLLERLEEEHQAGLVRLSRQHAALEQDLDQSATRAAAVLAALDDETLPLGTTPTRIALRDRLIDGLPLASGASAAADITAAAVADAEDMRRLLLSTTSSGHARSSTLHDLLLSVGARGSEPRYAQAFVEALGVNGVGRLVLALGTPSAETGVDASGRAIGALGKLLLTAVAPESSAGRDAGTARRLDSTAALLRDDLVASLSQVVEADSTGVRAAGYWILGQLLVGARQSGWSGRIPSPLLGRLAAGAAAAEIGETRDADAERQHGATLEPGAGARFASFFADADATGDALHTLLLEAGDDPVEVAALLSAPLDVQEVTNARGQPLVLAEALVRRWVTYEAAATSTHPDLALQTNDDLARLLAALGTVDDGAAGVRARVMAELARTSTFAQPEPSTVTLHDASSAGLESAAVAWLLEMPESIDAALAAPAAEAARTWSIPVGASHQPRLSLEELTGLIGAFAVEGGRPRAAVGTAGGAGSVGEDGSPAQPYQHLIEGELDRAAQLSLAAQGPDGLDDGVPGLDDVATRIGYFEQAASAALVTVARRRDAANQSMWRTLAEAKAVAVSWRSGPQALGLALATLATGGTNRSTQDDLVISIVRSHAELEQTLHDERRTASIAARLDDLRSGAGAAVPTTALLAAGASRGPSLPTSAEVAGARRQERLDALLTRQS